jgi:peroxiredoxin
VQEQGENHAMMHRKNNLPKLLILVMAIMLFTAACSGDQTSSSPEEVTAAEAAEIAAEPQSAADDTSEEDNPSFEETVIEPVSEAQREARNASVDSPAEAPTWATPTIEQMPVENVETEPLTAEPTPEPPQPANEEAPANLSVDPSVGSLAPDFQLTTLDGENISLTDLQGKNVLINYWATWCPPCLNELTALENIQSKFEGQDFVVVTINGIEQDNLGDVQATVQEYGITYPVLLDENETFWDAYRILFLPTSIYINEQGVIRFIKFGEQSETEFTDMIEQLLSDQL